MKQLLSILAIAVLAGGVAFAEDQDKKPDPGISVWLKELRRKISQIAPRKTVVMTTGVAGVRGAKDDAQVKLYWKGKKCEEAVTEEELSGFRDALDLLEKDDRDGAVRALDDLMKRFPDSPLIPDIKQTLDLVKAEGTASRAGTEQAPDAK